MSHQSSLVYATRKFCCKVTEMLQAEGSLSKEIGERAALQGKERATWPVTQRTFTRSPQNAAAASQHLSPQTRRVTATPSFSLSSIHSRRRACKYLLRGLLFVTRPASFPLSLHPPALVRPSLGLLRSPGKKCSEYRLTSRPAALDPTKLARQKPRQHE